MKSSETESTAFAETLEQRCLLSALYQNTQISSLPMSSNEYGPTSFEAYGNEALFQATNPQTGYQAIWITDGTRNGTKPLPIPFSGSQLLVGVNGNQLYFAVTGVQIQSFIIDQGSWLKTESAELYVTGNLGRSYRNLGRMPGGIGFGVSAAIGNEFFFNIVPDNYGSSDTLWVTNGTRAGTHIVDQINPIGTVTSIVPIADYLLVTTDSETITSLNLKSLQTQQIAVYPSDAGSDPVLFDGYAYFREHGDLARTDGTIQGTVDLYKGATNSIALPSLIDGIVPVGHQLYLFSPTELYVCSGSVNTIVPVAPLPTYVFVGTAAYDGKAVFALSDDSGDGSSSNNSGEISLWFSDGTSSGTRMIFPSLGSADLLATDSSLYYATSDIAGGNAPDGLALDHVLPGQVYLLSNLPAGDSNLALQVANVSLSDNVVGSNIKGSIQLIVRNNGGVVNTGSRTLEVYFATDPNGDGLTLVKTLNLNLRVPANSSKTITEPLNHLLNQAPGNYYVFAQIIDAGQVLAQATSAAPVALTAGATLSNLSYSLLPGKSLAIRFEIVDNSNVPLTGMYSASISYADPVQGDIVLAEPKIKLLARPRHPQYVSVKVPASGATIQSGEVLTVDIGGIFAQTSITT